MGGSPAPRALREGDPGARPDARPAQTPPCGTHDAEQRCDR
jgi:hypothetical protein